jgi:flagellar hook protein FlgE
MGLSSVMNTALSGLSAATTLVEVAADNLANAQTPGFKSSLVQFGTLAPQTLSFGTPVVAGSGGANPIQLGGGVFVSGIQRDFSQGPIVASDQPPLLALDGEGLFILQSPGGERLYTRDGQFQLNADGELVTADGYELLGFGVDERGQIDRSQLRPLTIRLGSTAAGVGGSVAVLRSYSINRTGGLVGHYSDGVNRTLGQLRLARFANPAGLAARAGNKFASTPSAGLSNETDSGEAGAAEVVSGARERSTVDIGHELIELTLAGNMFQANLAVWNTANTLLGELFFPWQRR